MKSEGIRTPSALQPPHAKQTKGNVMKERVSGLDLVRSIAALFVVSVHFFYNCGYYNAPMNTNTMVGMSLARWLFLCCVPLYMMLTGYFKLNKDISKSHYMVLIPVFTTYLVFSVIKIFVGNHYYGKLFGIKESFQSLGNYSMGWYIGFYFSLMLIAPFLNRMWHTLKNKKEQHILIISLTVISTLYPLVVLPAASETPWLACISSVLEICAPYYWQMLYPILYYFVGCYIRENQPKINKLILLAVIALMVLANTGISHYYAKDGTFIWTILGSVDCGYNCITVAICSVSIFLLLYNIDIKNGVIKKILQKISEVSLEIYMCSAIWDIILFDYAKARYTAMEDFAWLFFILVPINFTCSVLCSLVYKEIYKQLKKLIVKPKAN